MTSDYRTILSEFYGRQEEIIPMLQKVQDKFSYLPEESMTEIARFTGVSPSLVYGIATFYAQFRFTPTGKNVISVCRGTACHVRGGSLILEVVERELGITDGETTPDLEYSLETVACIGACALAPAMVVNENTFGKMTPSKVVEVIRRKEKEEKVE